ncbi:type IV pilus assembly protein PilM [Legionella jordanis]|nr:type IV pilus assembly protein PilM [Legionella jordanis]RMX15566.1 type IV pilus assembly protein PilM [Legionella jordanis]
MNVFRRFKYFNRPILGIDIGPLQVKIVQISRDLKECQVDFALSEALPPHAVIDNQIQDANAIVCCISKMLAKIGLTSNLAVLALPNSAVLCKLIQISNKVPEMEREQFILFEAAKLFANPAQELNFDFVIKGQSAMHNNALDVLLFASRAEHINSRLEIMNQLGLTAKAVEMESTSFERLLLWLGSSPNEFRSKTTGIVLIKNLSISLHVMEKATTIFSYEESFATQQWLKTLSKDTAGIFRQIPATQAKTEELPQELLLRQIKRMQQFFASTHKKSIDHFFLIAEMNDVFSFNERLREKLGTSVSIANPFARLKFSEDCSVKPAKARWPSFSLACGLALRSSLGHE